MKKIILFIAKTFLVILLLFAGILGYFTLTDYHPTEKINLLEDSEPTLLEDSSFTILSWNIGYAGLGADMDFFYDGGKQVRCSREQTLENLKSIKHFLTLNKKIDFIQLQEVDVDAKRSYGINEKDSIGKLFPHYLSLFAYNYFVKYVPVPFSEPMGKVEAGLLSLSKFIPTEATRYPFPGNYDWPTSLFMLDRCFIASRYKMKNGKELMIVNTHNSAYDDGHLKQQQLDYLINFLQQELNKGNYFVVAGDWNQNPPGLDISKYNNYSDSDKFILSTIDKTLFPSDWQWIFDKNNATNRSNVKPYLKGKSGTTVLDFFLISPNLKSNFVVTIDLDFQNSDHQPVIMNFSIQ